MAVFARESSFLSEMGGLKCQKSFFACDIHINSGLPTSRAVAVCHCAVFQKMKGENKMRNEFYEERHDNVIDALMSFLDMLPKNTVKMINFERYKDMMQTAAELKEILAENQEEGQLEINIRDMFNMGSITADMPELTVDNIPKFMRMISKADNFEIYPKINGTLQLNITFQSVLKNME